MKRTKSTREDTERPHIAGWPREHYNSDHSEKKQFSTERKAQRAARSIYNENGEVLNAYHCRYCGYWHIGHTTPLPVADTMDLLKRKVNIESTVINNIKREVDTLGMRLMSLTAKIEDVQLTILHHKQELKDIKKQ